MRLNNKGFTLVELLVVVLLITVVSVISSDMIISLTSTSTKIQNKISLEEEYSFLNVKLTKLIQDSDSVSYNSVSKKLSIVYPTKTFTLSFIESSSMLVLDNIQLTDSEIGKSAPFVLTVTGTNPQVVYISFGISKDFNNSRLKTEVKFEKRITLNKTYQQ